MEGTVKGLKIPWKAAVKQSVEGQGKAVTRQWKVKGRPCQGSGRSREGSDKAVEGQEEGRDKAVAGQEEGRDKAVAGQGSHVDDRVVSDSYARRYLRRRRARKGEALSWRRNGSGGTTERGQCPSMRHNATSVKGSGSTRQRPEEEDRTRKGAVLEGEGDGNGSRKTMSQRRTAGSPGSSAGWPQRCCRSRGLALSGPAGGRSGAAARAWCGAIRGDSGHFMVNAVRSDHSPRWFGPLHREDGLSLRHGKTWFSGCWNTIQGFSPSSPSPSPSPSSTTCSKWPGNLLRKDTVVDTVVTWTRAAAQPKRWHVDRLDRVDHLFSAWTGGRADLISSAAQSPGLGPQEWAPRHLRGERRRGRVREDEDEVEEDENEDEDRNMRHCLRDGTAVEAQDNGSRSKAERQWRHNRKTVPSAPDTARPAALRPARGRTLLKNGQGNSVEGQQKAGKRQRNVNQKTVHQRKAVKTEWKGRETPMKGSESSPCSCGSNRTVLRSQQRNHGERR